MRRLLKVAFVAVAVAASFQLDLSTQSEALAERCNCAACRDHEYGQPDLFYNFYQAPNCGGVGAQMYLAPMPIPPHVGHTYYTYQPFMPHELLYKHKRTYHRYYDEGRGLTRTSIRWR